MGRIDYFTNAVGEKEAWTIMLSSDAIYCEAYLATTRTHENTMLASSKRQAGVGRTLRVKHPRLHVGVTIVP